MRSWISVTDVSDGGDYNFKGCITIYPKQILMAKVKAAHGTSGSIFAPENKS